MEPGEIVALISVIGSVLVGCGTMGISALVAKSQARKDYIDSLQGAIIALQSENQRLTDRLRDYEARIDRLEKALDAKDDGYKLLEDSLRISGEAILNRDRQIVDLERQMVGLRARLKTLEAKRP